MPGPAHNAHPLNPDVGAQGFSPQARRLTRSPGKHGQAWGWLWSCGPCGNLIAHGSCRVPGSRWWRVSGSPGLRLCWSGMPGRGHSGGREQSMAAGGGQGEVQALPLGLRSEAVPGQAAGAWGPLVLCGTHLSVCSDSCSCHGWVCSLLGDAVLWLAPAVLLGHLTCF